MRGAVACVQKITYDEFLPALMGHKLDAYPGYDVSVDPRISTEFATSGYRLGHSMVSADIDFFDENANTLFPVGCRGLAAPWTCWCARAVLPCMCNVHVRLRVVWCVPWCGRGLVAGSPCC